VIQYLTVLVSQVQAIIWGILSLLGILVYADAIEVELTPVASNQFLMTLLSIYFNPKGKCMA
jgi:hypothetical protein